MGKVQVGKDACNNELASPKTLCWASQNVDQAFINSLIIEFNLENASICTDLWSALAGNLQKYKSELAISNESKIIITNIELQCYNPGTDEKGPFLVIDYDFSYDEETPGSVLSHAPCVKLLLKLDGTITQIQTSTTGQGSEGVQSKIYFSSSYPENCPENGTSHCVPGLFCIDACGTEMNEPGKGKITIDLGEVRGNFPSSCSGEEEYETVYSDCNHCICGGDVSLEGSYYTVKYTSSIKESSETLCCTSRDANNFKCDASESKCPDNASATSCISKSCSTEVTSTDIKKTVIHEYIQDDVGVYGIEGCECESCTTTPEDTSTRISYMYTMSINVTGMLAISKLNTFDECGESISLDQKNSKFTTLEQKCS